MCVVRRDTNLWNARNLPPRRTWFQSYVCFVTKLGTTIQIAHREKDPNWNLSRNVPGSLNCAQVTDLDLVASSIRTQTLQQGLNSDLSHSVAHFVETCLCHRLTNV